MDLLKYDDHTATVKLHLTELQILAKLRDPEVKDAILRTGADITYTRTGSMGVEFEMIFDAVRRTEGEPT